MGDPQAELLSLPKEYGTPAETLAWAQVRARLELLDGVQTDSAVPCPLDQPVGLVLGLGMPPAQLQHEGGPGESVTGATHAHWPPGSKGRPTDSDHRSARSATAAWPAVPRNHPLAEIGRL